MRSKVALNEKSEVRKAKNGQQNLGENFFSLMLSSSALVHHTNYFARDDDQTAPFTTVSS